MSVIIDHLIECFSAIITLVWHWLKTVSFIAAKWTNYQLNNSLKLLRRLTCHQQTSNDISDDSSLENWLRTWHTCILPVYLHLGKQIIKMLLLGAIQTIYRWHSQSPIVLLWLSWLSASIVLSAHSCLTLSDLMRYLWQQLWNDCSFCPHCQELLLNAQIYANRIITNSRQQDYGSCNAVQNTTTQHSALRSQ